MIPLISLFYSTGRAGSTARFLIEPVLILDGLGQQRDGNTVSFLIEPVLIAGGLTGSREGSQFLDCPVLIVDGLGQHARRTANTARLLMPP